MVENRRKNKDIRESYFYKQPIKDKVEHKRMDLPPLNYSQLEFKPSSEQQEIMRAAQMGTDIKVQAFAGTGKTTTIKLLSTVIHKRSQYIAFNKFIVDDVKSELPDHVKANTAHSMAYAEIVAKSIGYTRKFSEWEKLWWPSTVKEFSNNLVSPKLAPMVSRLVKRFLQSIDEVISEVHLSEADTKKIIKWTESENDKVIRLTLEFCQQHLDSTIEEIFSEITALFPYEIEPNQSIKNQQRKLLKIFFSRIQFQKLVNEVLKNFKNYSPNEHVTVEDFPSKELQRIESIGKPSFGQKNNQKELTNKIINVANVFWGNIKNQQSHCPIDFDCYLKLWQLSKPKIKADVIYIDEAQDLDPVMLDVLLNQEAQTIWLGDKYQQIYAWRGAVNALDTVKNCTEYRLTQTYRFPESIATVANLALIKLGEKSQIKTQINGKDLSIKGVNDRTAYISRTNKALLSQALTFADRGLYFHYADNNFKPSTIMRHCRSICELSHGKAPLMDIYQEFDDIHELKVFVEEDESSSIAMPYNLCEQFKFDYTKVQKIIEKIQYFNQVNSSLILTTAHRSKGQEWEEVVLLGDFEHFIVRAKEQGKMDEWNLLYVAMTRAKNKLSIGNEIKELLGIVIENELTKPVTANLTPNIGNSEIKCDKNNSEFDFESFEQFKDYFARSIKLFPHMQFTVNVSKRCRGLLLIITSPKIDLPIELKLNIDTTSCSIVGDKPLTELLAFAAFQEKYKAKRRKSRQENNIVHPTGKTEEPSNTISKPSNSDYAVKINDQVIYSGYIAGVSHNNIDGSSRQETLRFTQVNSPLELIHEKYNKYDSNAIRVEVRGKTLGYIARTDNLKLHQYNLNNLKAKLISKGQNDCGLFGGKIHICIEQNIKSRKHSLYESNYSNASKGF